MKSLCLVLLIVAVAIDRSSATILRARVWPPPLQTVTVAYNVGGGASDVSIKVRVPSQITGQTVMEIAANFDTRFRFTSQYFSNDLGYSLMTIGGVTADLVILSSGSCKLAQPLSHHTVQWATATGTPSMAQSCSGN